MPYVMLDDRHLGTIVDALRSEALRRQRVATRLAAEAIDGPDAKADVRSDSVKIARVLVDAAALEAAAFAIDTVVDATIEPDEPDDAVRRAMFDAGYTPAMVAAALMAAERTLRAGSELEVTVAGAEGEHRIPEHLERQAAPAAPVEPGHLLTGRPGTTTAAVIPAPAPATPPAEDAPTDDDVAEALAAMGMAEPESPE